jgi:hypothetical protein
MNMHDLIQMYELQDIYRRLIPFGSEEKENENARECMKVIINLRLGFNIDDQMLQDVDVIASDLDTIIQYASETKDAVNCSVEHEMKHASTELLYQPTITGWDRRGHVTFTVFVPRLPFTTTNTLHDLYSTQLFIQSYAWEKIAKNIGVPAGLIEIRSAQRLENGWLVNFEIDEISSIEELDSLDILKKIYQKKENAADVLMTTYDVLKLLDEKVDMPNKPTNFFLQSQNELVRDIVDIIVTIWPTIALIKLRKLATDPKSMRVICTLICEHTSSGAISSNEHTTPEHAFVIKRMKELNIEERRVVKVAASRFLEATVSQAKMNKAKEIGRSIAEVLA